MIALWIALDAVLTLALATALWLVTTCRRA
jgi:predicted Zn-ribbon and HTH transcriptional regulator